MPAPLDPRRMAELQDLIGPGFGPILESLEQSISAALDDAAAALTDGNLAAAAYAAHRCRNDALMVGASELQIALAALETATRGSDADAAGAAMARVRELWPGAREQLARAARPD
jgi:HPt (histidine-containing phosphotransfer) domain-containing protein